MTRIVQPALLALLASSVDARLSGPVNNTATTGGTIVDIAAATPDLSTLVTAVTAGGLVNTLSSRGPFTVFAPTNEAFAALPAGTLDNLLKPAAKQRLVDILLYHVVSGEVKAKDLSDGEVIKTVEGKAVTASVNNVGVFINNAMVTTADVAASNGVVHIINAVLLPSATTPTPAPGPAGNHLWFAGFTNQGYGNIRCGEVDAGPRMPDAIFKPSNAAALKAYEDITLALYGDYTYGSKQDLDLKLGRCADTGYTRKDTYPRKVDWAPIQLMDGICADKCRCNFCLNNTLEYPVRKCDETSPLPLCKDAPDDPRAAKWCSLCGPKFNAPISVNLFYCATGQNCPAPKANKPAADMAQVLKDLLALL
jgi:uncharacterized surface protein with fasciclin (FAS1) repeats